MMKEKIELPIAVSNPNIGCPDHEYIQEDLSGILMSYCGLGLFGDCERCRKVTELQRQLARPISAIIYK